MSKAIEDFRRQELEWVRMNSKERIAAFIHRWSPEERERSAQFSADFYQIIQGLQSEQYEMLRPALENFLNTHTRPFMLEAL